jgi:ATP-dependent Lon protease
MVEEKDNQQTEVEPLVADPDDFTGSAVSVRSGPSVDGGDAADRIPSELPVLPLRDVVVFPGTVMPLRISRKRVQRLLDHALAGSRMVCAAPQRFSETENPKLDDLYRVGTACLILKLMRGDDGSETIIVHGICRVGLVSIPQETPFLMAEVQARADDITFTPEIEALMHSVRQNARRAIEMSPNVPDEAVDVLESVPTPGGLADFLAANLTLELVLKQELLETFDVKDRLTKVNKAIAHQVEVLEISQQIQSQVRHQIDETQREYYLREQMKAIQQELGQTDSRNADVDRLRERVAEAKLSEEALKEANRELERLEVIPQASPEYSNSLNYLEWLSDLPWQKSTEDQLEIALARKILDEDHFGLDKVKKRILEFLAVRKLKADGRGPILCFAGPPGVGKTSLGRSIARAMNRKFIRMSLGGMHDEADIRGHRRTYIGAMPGRIVQELRKAASNNPVFMLDEVDKIGKDFRGDPASALLEVLDPAQNSTFRDHFLDVSFDLSRVLFIATANYMGAIPGPLLDRMEVIDISGYTHREKLQIAKRYLVPRQLEETGLAKSKIKFDDEALREIIAKYTREAGVRELERKIGAVCRSRAMAQVSGKRRSVRVTVASLEKDLGLPTHESELAAREAAPGVVTGLAFTPVGGEILFVEAGKMPGTGRLKLTGQIGEVMRESAEAAYSIVKYRGSDWGVDAGAMAKMDYHIHVPAGAVPKDGPSAGVAMLVSLVSILSEEPVDPRTGMTGEITLRGAVLPIGGVREKVLAGHRAGLKRILLPQRNLKDLQDVPKDVREDIDFVGVKTIDQLIKHVLPGAAKGKKSTAKKKDDDKSSRSETEAVASEAGTSGGSRKSAASGR